jgi:hypothetical protein
LDFSHHVFLDFHNLPPFSKDSYVFDSKELQSNPTNSQRSSQQQALLTSDDLLLLVRLVQKSLLIAERAGARKSSGALRAFPQPRAKRAKLRTFYFAEKRVKYGSGRFGAKEIVGLPNWGHNAQ